MKIKKIISCILSLCIASGTIHFTAHSSAKELFTASAAETTLSEPLSGKIGDNITWVLNTNGTLVLSGSGEMTDFEVLMKRYGLGQFDVKWVEGCAPPWFDIRENITEVIIDGDITYLGQHAFADCNNLVKVTMSDSIKEIGYSAFIHCDSLKDIEFSENLTTIGSDSIEYCTSLTEITFPESVSYIGSAVLYYNINLAKVTIENPNCEIYDDSDTIANYSDFNFDGVYEGEIYGYNGSTAQTYAEKYECKFVSLGNPPDRRGDVNNDKEVDPIDATLVLRQYTAESLNAENVIPENYLPYADANNDGVTDPNDATLILRYFSYKSTGGTESIVDFLEK